jgi:hypothetical protein
MTAADDLFNNLLNQCASPSDANTRLKGFSGAAGYRSRYAQEYGTKCKQTNAGTNNDQLYTSLLNQCASPSDANTKLKGFSGAESYRTRYAQDYAAKCKQTNAGTNNKDDNNKPVVGGEYTTCPTTGYQGYVFCNKKYRKANLLSGTAETTEKNWKLCRERCWKHGVACRGWSWREGSGTCQMYNVGNSDQLVYEKGFASGPRSNPSTSNGGSDDTSTDSGNNDSGNNESSNENPAFSTTWTGNSSEKEWWRRDDYIKGVETWVLIAFVCCLCVVMGAGMLMMMLVM